MSAGPVPARIPPLATLSGFRCILSLMGVNRTCPAALSGPGLARSYIANERFRLLKTPAPAALAGLVHDFAL